MNSEKVDLIEIEKTMVVTRDQEEYGGRITVGKLADESQVTVRKKTYITLLIY